MKRSVLAAALLVAAQASVIACQPAYQGRTFSERQERQRDRIDDGRADGDLSRREAARLRDRSHDIAEDRRDARADGYVDRRERRQLDREQDKLNRDIYRQRHDDDGR